MDKVKIGVLGLGKMGLNHFVIIDSHPKAQTVGCDEAGFMVDVLSKNIFAPVHRNYDEILEREPLDAVLNATHSRLHAPMVEAALANGLHIFCEKPFDLACADSQRLTGMAVDKRLLAQISYHYHYVGAFQELKRLIEAGAIGRITHVLAEPCGPVMLQFKRTIWRNDKSEGGGCPCDYDSHPMNLLSWIFGTRGQVMGSHLEQVFYEGTDDEMFSTLRWNDESIARLSVKWSDESYQMMSTRITLIGAKPAVRRAAGMPSLPAQIRRRRARLRCGLDYEVHHGADRGQLVLPPGRGVFGAGGRVHRGGDGGKVPGSIERFRFRDRDRPVRWRGPRRCAPAREEARLVREVTEMEKLLFGDNQFFCINHMSEDAPRAEAMRLYRSDATMDMLDTPYDAGIQAFMCTAYDRFAELVACVKADPARHSEFQFYPCPPYSRKYANAVTDHGILAALRKFVTKDGFFSTALATKEIGGMARVLIDMEIKMSEGLKVPVVFVQTVIVKLMLGIGFTCCSRIFDEANREKWGTEPGYTTMNMPVLLDALKSGHVRAVAMSVYAFGAIPSDKAIHWISELPGVASIVFGAFSAGNIHGTRSTPQRPQSAWWASPAGGRKSSSRSIATGCPS